jgi:hypothetical protein
VKHNFVKGFLWLALLGGCCLYAVAQPSHHRRMAHQQSTLFVARADARQVVPAGRSGATATGAFILAVKGRDARLEYDLTFDGLQNGPASAIRLYNFGPGANGKVVHIICGRGEGSQACPQATGATVTGVWTSDDRMPLSPQLVSELAAQRIYVEIESGQRGTPEIRSQLMQQSFMAMTKSFVARLGREGDARRGVTGTATFDFVRIDARRTFIIFDLTVTGLAAPVTAVNIMPADGTRTLMLNVPIKTSYRKSRATISGQLDAGQLPQLRNLNLMEGLRSGQFVVNVLTAARSGALSAKLTPLP